MPERPSDKAPTILVTGGAGFLGHEVLRRLAAAAGTIVAVYHHRLPETLDSVYPVAADLNTPELLAAPLRGVDTVVHLAWEGGLAGPRGALGERAFDPAAPTSAQPASARMTRHLVSAMEKAGTRRLVFVSALGAAADAPTAFLREKYLAESLVLNSRLPEKVILRPSIVFGTQAATDRFLRTLLRVLRFTVYPVPRQRQGASVAPVHVRDLADVVALAATHPLGDAEAALLDVHGGQAYAPAELFRIVSQAYVKKTRIALGGRLGESLLPWVERDRRNTATTPKLSEFLALSGDVGGTETGNPLAAVLPKRLASFQEAVGEH